MHSPFDLTIQDSAYIELQKDLDEFMQTYYPIYQALYNCPVSQRQYDSPACGREASSGQTQTAESLTLKRSTSQANQKLLQTALECAIESGSCAAVSLLLNNGANVNSQEGSFDGSPLYLASWFGDYNIIKLLLDRGAETNQQDKYLGNAMQAASWAGRREVIELLRSYGADVNAQSGYFGNALQVASWGGDYQVVKLLISCGANVNAQGGYYGNALQAASWKGHVRIVKLLIDMKADVNAIGGRYGSALDAALIRGHRRVIGLLRFWRIRRCLGIICVH